MKVFGDSGAGAALLTRLARAGLDLCAESGVLIVGPTDRLTSDDRRAVADGRAAVLRALERPAALAGRGLSANRWAIYMPDGAVVVATFAPAASFADVRARYLRAVAAIETESSTPACQLCDRASRYGNCGDPVAAGLADRHVLIRHPRGGAGCPAYRPAHDPGP